MKKLFLIVLLISVSDTLLAQPTPFILKGALKENRQQLYQKLLNNTINKNLSLPLTDSTEDNWIDAFWGMEIINFKSPYTDNKVSEAVYEIDKRNPSFQRSLLELIYTNYPNSFEKKIIDLLQATTDPKIFSLCVVYLLNQVNGNQQKPFLLKKLQERIVNERNNPFYQQLQYLLTEKKWTSPDLKSLFQSDFLKNSVVVFSLQRKNRNFPGLAIVRDSLGNFVYDRDKMFSVPQLARSISNLPGFLTNGNTPEGIFRMDGLDTSKSSFIGPTPNIQLTMPFEFKASHFFQDSTLMDSVWSVDMYKKLLPAILREYYPIYQSFYAGMAGRTEIIAHGTTIDPNWYKGAPFFPLTPTQGCLCTKEIWNEETGRLVQSDQQKLADAVIKAGGAKGYLIVINIDDQQSPVTLEDILAIMPQLSAK